MAEPYKIIQIVTEGKPVKTIQCSADKLIVFKVGNNHFPATPEMIEDMIKNIEGAVKNNSIIVTHHAVEVLEVPL